MMSHLNTLRSVLYVIFSLPTQKQIIFTGLLMRRMFTGVLTFKSIFARLFVFPYYFFYRNCFFNIGYFCHILVFL